ncbi:MAG: hypothetical protein ACKVP0_20465 [Pirellulaceae bacterium]
MSNPLLKPNDPRFTKPSLTDAAGRNVFAEGTGNEVVAASAVDGSSATLDDNIYRSSADSAPYQPRFEVSQGHRGVLLLVLATTGLVGSLLGFASLSGLWVLGWVFSFLSVVPAACAMGLGWQDLRAIRVGAMDPMGRNLTQIAFWLGSLGVFFSVAMDAAVIYFAIYLMMSLF